MDLEELFTDDPTELPRSSEQLLLEGSIDESEHRPPVLIVGAGLSGLVAANALAAGGRRSIVLDKGRSVGGRLATRRMSGLDGRAALLDHGAQFFTVRSPDFAELVHDWRRAGVVREWCRGFTGNGDGYPRYCAEGGMSTIAKLLGATADVECGVELRSVAGFDSLLSLTTEDGRRWESDSVILTPPVPQSLALCENGWLPLPEEAEASLRAVTYVPCFALLVTLDRPSGIPYPGGLQLTVDDDDIFSFVGDNLAKDISEVPAVTFHTNDSFSLTHFDDNADTLRTYLLDAAQHYLGEAKVVNAELKRWKFARPVAGHHSLCLPVEPLPGTTLVFAGDAFGAAKMEGAALSGLAAAEAILLAG